MTERIKQQSTDQPAIPSTAASPPSIKLPAELAANVSKATAAAAHLRYPTVADLRADLARLVSGHPVAAMRGGLAYVLRCFARRRRVAVGISAALVVLAGLSGSYSIAQVRDARDQAQIAAQRATIEAHRSAPVQRPQTIPFPVPRRFQ